ncbi:MAG TPA: hypothetical protein VN611_00165 [Patescibacteria group bacterium]|nr:hypothetical protein [Patescibacteria group bacterium]
MKRRRWIAIAAMAFLTLFCLLTFRDSLTPYVTFAQARSMNGSVQVRGTLVPGTLAAANMYAYYADKSTNFVQGWQHPDFKALILKSGHPDFDWRILKIFHEISE